MRLRIDFGPVEQALQVGTVWRVITKGIDTNGYVPVVTLERLMTENPSVYFNGSHICLTLPSTTDNGRTHTVILESWRQLESILKARYRETSRSQMKIGTRAAPVQYDLDKIVRAMPKKRLEETEITLEDILGAIP